MRELFRPVVTLLSGSVIAQSVIYLARPVLTRLFTPEEFGIFGFYIATVAVLAALSTGKFDDAVVLPSDHRDGWALVGVSLLTTLVLASLVLLALPGRHWLAGVLENSSAARYLVWLPISILLVGTIRVFDSWLTRLKVFSGIASGRVSYAVSSAPTQIASGSMGAAAGGLIGGIIGGQAVQALALVARGLRERRRVERQKWSAEHLRQMAGRYRRFALFGAPASALNVASVQTPALMLLFFFDASVLGRYTIAYASLGVPLTLLGSAVAQVYYVSATEALRTSTLPTITEAVVTRLVALGLMPLACIVLVGPDLFQLVFGSAWREAGTYAGFLAPWIFFLLLTAPLSRLFDVLEKQRALLVYNAALLTTRIASIAAGGIAGSDKLAIGLFGLSGAALALGQVLWLVRLSGWRIAKAVAVTGQFSLISAPFLFALWLSSRMDLGTVAVSSIAVVTVLLYLAIIHRRYPTLFRPKDASST